MNEAIKDQKALNGKNSKIGCTSPSNIKKGSRLFDRRQISVNVIKSGLIS